MRSFVDDGAAVAHLGGRLATGLAEVTDDPAALDGTGRWAVVMTYEGQLTCARFEHWQPAPTPPPARPWRGPRPDAWESSLDRTAYVAGVERIRRHIADGTVYQANLCRIMSAPLPSGPGGPTDLTGLAAVLAERHDAPHAGLVRIPGVPRAPGLEVVTASPELFLRRSGRSITSSPIKGTGRTAADLTAKDEAENVMIVDLVRNDLSRVCETGSVGVDALLAVEAHPGLVHLVSTVSGTLLPGAGWADILGATFPPGSVTGAPKSSALQVIAELEPVPRGPYCGAIGWVDADEGRAELAVGIRTFWTDVRAGNGFLHFGTGAGITWGSDPQREWAETELKAERLVGLASCASG